MRSKLHVLIANMVSCSPVSSVCLRTMLDSAFCLTILFNCLVLNDDVLAASPEGILKIVWTMRKSINPHIVFEVMEVENSQHTSCVGHETVSVHGRKAHSKSINQILRDSCFIYIQNSLVKELRYE